MERKQIKKFQTVTLPSLLTRLETATGRAVDVVIDIEDILNVCAPKADGTGYPANLPPMSAPISGAAIAVPTPAAIPSASRLNIVETICENNSEHVLGMLVSAIEDICKDPHVKSAVARTINKIAVRAIPGTNISSRLVHMYNSTLLYDAVFAAGRPGLISREQLYELFESLFHIQEKILVKQFTEKILPQQQQKLDDAFGRITSIEIDLPSVLETLSQPQLRLRVAKLIVENNSSQVLQPLVSLFQKLCAGMG